MFYCKFCGCYLGLSLQYYCDFCANLRRVVLVYKKPIINELFRKNLIGVKLGETETSEKDKRKKDIDEIDLKKIEF